LGEGEDLITSLGEVGKKFDDAKNIFGRTPMLTHPG
jgi:hypothetical protein